MLLYYRIILSDEMHMDNNERVQRYQRSLREKNHLNKTCQHSYTMSILRHQYSWRVKKMGTHAHQYLVRYDKIFRLIATTGRCVVHCLCVEHYNIFNMLTNMVDSIDRLIRGMKAG